MPSNIAIVFDVLSGPAVVYVSADIGLLPSLDYNIMVSGANSTVNSVDTSFAMNWYPTPAN